MTSFLESRAHQFQESRAHQRNSGGTPKYPDIIDETDGWITMVRISGWAYGYTSYSSNDQQSASDVPLPIGFPTVPSDVDPWVERVWYDLSDTPAYEIAPLAHDSRGDARWLCGQSTAYVNYDGTISELRITTNSDKWGGPNGTCIYETRYGGSGAWTQIWSTGMPDQPDFHDWWMGRVYADHPNLSSLIFWSRNAMVMDVKATIDTSWIVQELIGGVLVDKNVAVNFIREYYNTEETPWGRSVLLNICAERMAAYSVHALPKGAHVTLTIGHDGNTVVNDGWGIGGAGGPLFVPVGLCGRLNGGEGTAFLDFVGLAKSLVKFPLIPHLYAEKHMDWNPPSMSTTGPGEADNGHYGFWGPPSFTPFTSTPGQMNYYPPSNGLTTLEDGSIFDAAGTTASVSSSTGDLTETTGT